MAYSIAQTLVPLSNEITAFPTPLQLTGTVSSSGTVVTGTGTDFLTEGCYPNLDISKIRYPYIFNPSSGEIREITAIPNATTLMIKNAFSVALSGDDFYVIDDTELYKTISVNGQSGTNKICTVGADPVTMDNNVIENFGTEDGWQLPIGIDASAAQVTLQR